MHRAGLGHLAQPREESSERHKLGAVRHVTPREDVLVEQESASGEEALGDL
jgi:hypothetical protein